MGINLYPGKEVLGNLYMYVRLNAIPEIQAGQHVCFFYDAIIMLLL